MTQHDSEPTREEPHSVLPYVLVWAALLCLTVVTFGLSRVELGPFHVPVALTIATVKAGLVVGVFMHLRHHGGANRLVFAVALFFVALLMGLTVADVATRLPSARPGDPSFLPDTTVPLP
jgi:cytochrome c oxidase subunit IV